MKLYYIDHTRAFRPRWLLEELGADYELVRLDPQKREHKSPDYLAIHPLGSVPALDDDGQIILETIAICMHIADRHLDSGVAPDLGTARRAAYYQWLSYAASTVEPCISDAYMRSFSLPPERREESATPDEQETFDWIITPLTDHLAQRPFVLGDRFSAADVVVAGVLDWADRCGFGEYLGAGATYLQTMRDRPAYQRALAPADQ